MDLRLADEGVAVLCAFCERHGPSILFVTSKLNAERAKDVFEEPPVASAVLSPRLLGDESNAKFEDVPLESRRLSQLFSPQEKASATSSAAAACGGCKSVEVEDGFVSFAGRQFCTSSKFPESRLYAMVRQVCVRSLSCEHVPGREGPVVFGQEGNGAVLSFPFQIADSQARGFSRTYSLCAIHRDASLLLAATRFVTDSFAAVQKEMRSRALALFQAEQRVDGGGTGTIALRRVPNAAAARSLGQLMGCDSFFQKLHGSFCNVLFGLGAAPAAGVDSEGKLALADVLSALGRDKFGLLVAHLLSGGPLCVLYELPQQAALSERLWDSLKVLSPRAEELLRHEQQGTTTRGVDWAVLQVAEGPKIHFLPCVASAKSLRAAVGARVVREVFGVAEKRIDLKSERMLLEAAVLEHAAAASVCGDRKTMALFCLTAESDGLLLEAWKSVLEEK
jgi:hypothetical protein